MRFHHVGYAVKDIQRYLDDIFVAVFQPLAVSEIIHDPLQKVAVCFAEMAGGTTIELVEPRGENSPVDKIIGSRRGGIYHLCYEVVSLDDSMKRMREKRCMPLGRPTPAVAFGGRRIVFMMTPQNDLIELLEEQR